MYRLFVARSSFVIGLLALLAGLLALAPMAPLQAYQAVPGTTTAVAVCKFNSAAPSAAAPTAIPGGGSATSGPPALVEQCQIDGVVDWQAGTSSGLLITNNAGGELRLTEDQQQGSFTSAFFPTPFPINAAGAVWRAEVPQGTELLLELRARATPPAADAPEAGWGPWQRLDAGDARSQADDGAFATPNVLALPLDTRYLQLRATFSSSVARASAVLDRVTIAYLNTSSGPMVPPQSLQPAPITFGPDTLTPRPALIPRSTWSARTIAARPERAVPRGIIIHQISATTVPSETLALLRGLASYQTQVLGWDDMPYHYLIDESGVLFEGRLGGPTAAVSRLAGGTDAIHIALMGNPAAAPSSAAQNVLVNLLAWLGQAYTIPPTGQHTVRVGENLVTRPNIVAHNEVAPEARDPGQPVRDLLPQLRTRADQATIRARWYFAEGNVQDYSQRLVLFNPTGAATEASVTLYRPGETGLQPVISRVPVPANGRADLVASSVVSDTNTLPAIVESSAPIIVERSLSLGSDITNGPGISQLSRVWYFAEGSTDSGFQTYLALFNPQSTATTASVTYIKGDGTLAQQNVTIPANQRVVVTVGDDTTPQMRGVGFGIRVIATQPIAAERTMRFGPNGSGLHTAPGIVELSRRWYFAEGTTQGSFQMRLLLLNPNRQTANATVTFMAADNVAQTRRYAIPPTTRLVVDVNEVVPGEGVATMVTADRPLAVERALYFNDGAAGTVTAGATQAAYVWRFAEGRSADASQFLLLSNPNQRAAVVDTEFILFDGTRETQRVVVPANARYTLAVHEFYPGETAISAIVRSTQPIIAERSLFPGGGVRGGSTALGVPAEQ